MLKSGEDIIADVKELKSNDEVVGYYFMDPQVVKVEDHLTFVEWSFIM